MTLIRLFALSIAACGFIYVPAILGFAKTVVPEKSNGSLIVADGKIVGSRLIAQAFTGDRYFHPRPSACDYNASGAAGSNLSPKSPQLTERAETILATYRSGNPIPADLVTASGSGLDPHITRDAANYQISRISAARNLPPETISRLLGTGPLINVLEINLALDDIK